MSPEVKYNDFIIHWFTAYKDRKETTAFKEQSCTYLEETVSSHMLVHKLCEKYQLVNISCQDFLDRVLIPRN